MRTALALDPGGTTGWSLWQYDAVTPLRHIEHGMVSGGLRGFLGWWERTVESDGSLEALDEVVIEDFILDGRTLKPDTTALEIIGAVEHAVHGTNVHLARQRNVMKAHAKDEKLKQLGLWWPGAGHDRDSMRHMIAFMKVTKHMPTLKWLYPQAGTSIHR